LGLNVDHAGHDGPDSVWAIWQMHGASEGKMEVMDMASMKGGGHASH